MGFKLICFIFALIIGLYAQEEEAGPSDVVVLGDDNFDETIANNDYVFAEFYAPWCGHCKRLAPDYEIVATHFKTVGSPVVIAKVDATQNNNVATAAGIRGYPTLKFYKKGVAIDYEGGRTPDELIKWITKKTSAPSIAVESSETLEEVKNGFGLRVVGYLSSGNVPTFQATADQATLDDFQFYHVTDESLFGGNAKESVTILKAGEDPVVYSGELTQEKLTEWILNEGYPLYEELAQRIWLRSTTAQKPLLAIFAQEKDDATDVLVKAIAAQFKGRVLSSLSTAPALADRWGASGTVFPTGILVTWSGADPKLTVYDEESGPFTVESAAAFIESAIKGEYKGFKKSQPIPESNDGPVTVLVGKTFEQIVNDAEKDVFVEFYAPWCGHCKNLAPVWEELGKSFSNVPSVVIANLDATANSYPENLEIQGFPTLIFFKANDKTPIPYSGDRELASLKAFVLEQASITIERKEEL
jgi:protein disulfide-isomerase A1